MQKPKITPLQNNLIRDGPSGSYKVPEFVAGKEMITLKQLSMRYVARNLQLSRARNRFNLPCDWKRFGEPLFETMRLVFNNVLPFDAFRFMAYFAEVCGVDRHPLLHQCHLHRVNLGADLYWWPAAFAEWQTWPLTDLTLRNVGLTDELCSHLSKLSALKYLNLSHNTVSATGVAHLLRPTLMGQDMLPPEEDWGEELPYPGLYRLRELDLSCNSRITRDVLPTVLRCRYLQRLHLTGCQILGQFFNAVMRRSDCPWQYTNGIPPNFTSPRSIPCQDYISREPMANTFLEDSKPFGYCHKEKDFGPFVYLQRQSTKSAHILTLKEYETAIEDFFKPAERRIEKPPPALYPKKVLPARTEIVRLTPSAPPLYDFSPFSQSQPKKAKKTSNVKKTSAVSQPTLSKAFLNVENRAPATNKATSPKEADEKGDFNPFACKY